MPDEALEESDYSDSSATESVAPRTLESVLQFHTRNMAEFLDSKRPHPVWEPAETQDGEPAWDRGDVERLTALHIPQVPSFKNPDMLLYQLGHLETLDPSFSKRIEDFLSGDNHLYLSNASGTGKTRLVFEVLARHWGLYFTCTADRITDPYGSSDVSRSLSDVSSVLVDGTPLVDDMATSSRLRQSRVAAVQHNRRIAHHVFRRLVLSRLLMLREFCKVANERRIPDDEAKLKWLFVQLRPQVILGNDAFEQVLLYCDPLTDADVSERLEALWSDLQSKLSFIAVDEAQIALNSYRASFTTANVDQQAPVIRELVIVLGSICPTARLIVSGVQLDMSVVSEALSEADFQTDAIRHFHSLGHFASTQQCGRYLRHFFGDSVSERNCETVYQWLHGRHRIIALLAMFTLRFGARNIVPIMDTLLHRLTGYQRPNFPLLNHHVILSLTIVMKDGYTEVSPARFVLRKALMTYAVHHRPTTTDLHAPLLVRMTVALYGDSASSAVIFEPFILLNLARWLATSTQCGIHGIIRHRLAHDGAYSLSSVAFIEGLAPCLWDAVREAPTLQTIFSFPGRKPPWSRHGARFVLPRLARSSSVFDSVPTSLDSITHVASSSADVFDWLNDASHPFLIPDRELGAELLFMLELPDAGAVLVCVHADAFKSVRSRRDTRVSLSNPGDFYKDNRGARDRFLSALKSLPPLGLDDGSARGHARRRARLAKFSTLQLLCFEDPFRRNTAYDPPIANIDFPALLRRPRPQEFTFAQIHQTIVRV